MEGVGTLWILPTPKVCDRLLVVEGLTDLDMVQMEGGSSCVGFEYALRGDVPVSVPTDSE